MITKDYTITSAQGIHARPATALVKLTKNYESVISIKKGEKTVKLNSLLNILSLAAKCGEAISITADGQDETAAIEAIDQFFNDHLKGL